MCLAIPSEVVEIQDNVGTVDVDGVKRSVSLMLLENVSLGDYVIVHAGFAIKVLDRALALESLEFLKKAAMYNGNLANADN